MTCPKTGKHLTQTVDLLLLKHCTDPRKIERRRKNLIVLNQSRDSFWQGRFGDINRSNVLKDSLW